MMFLMFLGTMAVLLISLDKTLGVLANYDDRRRK